jgi:hypothetical protein
MLQVTAVARRRKAYSRSRVEDVERFDQPNDASRFKGKNDLFSVHVNGFALYTAGDFPDCAAPPNFLLFEVTAEIGREKSFPNVDSGACVVFNFS